MMALSRRGFLRSMGWIGGGLVVVAGAAHALSPWPALPHRRAPAPSDAAAWLRLTRDGSIEVLMPRAELGQGIAVCFRQIVAEETGFPLDRVVAVQPRTDLTPPARATVGSDSIKDFGPLLAEAALALARVLEREGSKAGRTPTSGWAAIADRHRLIDAAMLGAANGRPVSFTSGPKRVVGTSPATDQIRAIVTGEAPVFTDDVRLPNMAYGAALREPRLGATLASVDDTAVRALPGYLGVRRIGKRAFVVAESRGALERVLSSVSASWEGGIDGGPDVLAAVDVDTGLARGALEHIETDSRFMPGERFDVDLRLSVPMAAHAAMEPRCAVARFDDDGRLDVWTGTQDITFVRAVLAKELGLSVDRVTVIGCRVGGGFGGKTICTVELEAALLARATRRPVKVQWSRLDEFRETFHRPPSSHRIRARLASDGRIDAWHHAFRSGHVIFTSAAMGPFMQFATSFVGDPGVRRGAIPPYAAARSRIEFEDVRLPVPTGPWRGLGAAPNVWAIETAIDELARALKEDPVSFRTRIIDERWPRLQRVLARVATLAGWPVLRSTSERGYGVACGVYKEMSYAAVIAEVTRDEGGPRVTRLWCAHDCGMMINPDQVRAQVEGNLVWGIGMALSEELTLADGHVEQSSFADYGVPHFSAIPEMTIDLVDEGDAATGAGETAIVAATPAITNAIAAMTGRPVTRLPYRSGQMP